MKLAPGKPHRYLVLVLAAAASAQVIAFDYSAQIAAQQRESARQAMERSQQMLSAQRQAEMMQANRMAQMRQENQLNDLGQQELRKSADRVYGLDRPVGMPAPSTATAVDMQRGTPANDNARASAGTGPVFPAQSLWADFAAQRVVAFQQDGTFKMFIHRDGKVTPMAGRYEVAGQQVKFLYGNSVESFNWSVGIRPEPNGRAQIRLQLSNGQAVLNWLACPTCPTS